MIGTADQIYGVIFCRKTGGLDVKQELIFLPKVQFLIAGRISIGVRKCKHESLLLVKNLTDKACIFHSITHMEKVLKKIQKDASVCLDLFTKVI